MALVPVQKRRRSDIEGLHQEMDDLFRTFLGSWGPPLFEHRVWPAIDIEEDENAITVMAEVPGCKADDIEIAIHGNTLSISGEKKHAEEKKEKGYCHLERSYGSFRRDLNIPADIDPEKVEANCTNGVLSITLPKAEKAKAIKVKVKS